MVSSLCADINIRLHDLLHVTLLILYPFTPAYGFISLYFMRIHRILYNTDGESPILIFNNKAKALKLHFLIAVKNSQTVLLNVTLEKIINAFLSVYSLKSIRRTVPTLGFI